MGRLVGCENDGTAPEEDSNHVGTRSRKFLSFGITRVSYPESEVREFVTYSYASQVAKQLTYNHWIDGQGYSEVTMDEVGAGYAADIKNTSKRGEWMLDNARLMLSMPIIKSKDTEKWKPLDETWSSRISREVNDVMTDVADKKAWVNALTEKCKNFFDRDFRNQGVKGFYSTQRSELKANAQCIRRHIENKLFTDWAAGNRSVLEIEKFVSLLIDDCNSRIDEFEKQKSRLSNEELQAATDKMKAEKTEYDNVKWLMDALTGASGKILGRYQNAIVEYYTTATRIEAYDFAKAQLSEVVIHLGQLLEGVKSFKTTINQINDEVTKQAASKCKTNEAQDDANIKKYDPEKVRTIVRQYTSNQDYQKKASLQVRNSLISQLGEDGERSFANLFNTVHMDTTSDIILDICTNHAVEAMKETAQTDPLSKMVGVNILEKLKLELNTDEKLEAFVKSLEAASRPYIQFNDTETTKQTQGAMQTMIQVSIPQGDQNTEAFRKKLIEAFSNEHSDFDPSQDVSINYNSNEIVCVSAKSGFPLRFLQNLPTLRDKYNRLLADPKGDFNRLLLHTETFREPLPALYELSGAEIRQEIIKPIMLAYTLGLIVDKEDPSTGRHFSAIMEEGDFGPEWVELGKDFGGVWEKLANDAQKRNTLLKLVKQKLLSDARTNEQKHALKPLLGQVLKGQVMNSLCEGNEFHRDFAKYRAFAKEILENELKEL